MSFKKATKKKSKARIALIGPAGSGKTFTALRLAHGLSEGGSIAVFDTERGSASKYAGDPNPDGGSFEFDCMDDMTDFDVRRYINAIEEAGKSGYDVLIIDSLSHAWAGVGGLLEFVDSKAGNSANKFTAWRDATPLHNKLIDAILNAPLHIIATMRSKTEYVIEKDEKGRSVPRKVGMQPIQRDGLEYEFDVILDVDSSSVIIGKSRCPQLKGRFVEPGADVAQILSRWLSDGAVQTEPQEDANWQEDSEYFCETLKEIGTTYDKVSELCKKLQKPRPAYNTREARIKLLEWLKTEKGQKALEVL